MWIVLNKGAFTKKFRHALAEFGGRYGGGGGGFE